MDSSRARQKRTRIACKPCRQNKIRCGMRSPPCARCSRLGIECTIEPHFRRTNQRDRVHQLEHHVEELHQVLMGTAEPDGAVLPIGSSDVVTAEAPVGAARRDAEQGRLEQVRNDHNTYELGPVTLDAVQVGRLHAIFLCKYHPMLPILNDTRPAAESYRTSPLLFWSIIAVAARHYDADMGLLPRLTPPLEELLHTTVLSGLASVAQVQAVVLLGYWPLPNYRLLTNNSLLYANIALTSAMKLGLHRPGHEQEYASESTCLSLDTICERGRTWVAIVILSQSTTTDLGLPPIIPVIDDMRSQSLAGIPTVLQHNLMIQECSYQTITSLIGEIQSSNTFYTRLNSLERNFDDLQDSICKDLSFTNSIRLVSARLYLQCMFFLQPEATSSAADQLQQQHQRRNGVLRAYRTAISLINTAISHEDSLGELPYMPAEIPRMIFAAALVVFRVANSSFATPMLPLSSLDLGPSSESGRTSYSMACFAIHRCSMQRGDNKDLAARMVDVLRAIWRGAEADTHLQSQEPVVKVTSRMGAGIVFDCLKIWRSKYKRNSLHRQSGLDHRSNIDQDLAGPAPSSQGVLPNYVLPHSPSLTQPSGWEGLDWNLHDLSGQDPEDWTLYELL
ncbi:hypothetical protein BJX99DRAFT_262141 [Aspergillus californicus]